MDQLLGNWLTQAGGICAVLALLAYAGAALWLASRPKARMAALMPSRRALVFAVGGVALWALAWASFGPVSTELGVGGAVRNLGFILWLSATFVLSGGNGRALSARLMLLTLMVTNLVCFLFGGLAIIDIQLSGLEIETDWLTRALLIVDMLTASAGLVLIEQCVRHRGPNLRMPVLVVAGGIAAIWAYGLNIHLLSWLAERPPLALILIEPLVVAFVLPAFVLVAIDMGRDRIQLSRSIAVRTVAVLGLVTYLVVVALTAAFARLVGGDYGDLVQAVLLALALGLGALMAASARARAWMSVMVSKHFFEHRYDYRAEWMRFTATLEGQDGQMDQPFRRIARALAELANSPGAMLLTADTDGDYRPAGHWGWPPDAEAGQTVPIRAAFMLQESGRIVEIDAMRDGRDDEGKLALPEWILSDPRAWVLLPLQHVGRMVGIALLLRPMASRPLDWEDLDVLRISSRQAASYIAEMQSQSALSEARRFDEFNRRFAFIMHDVKNLASQLGLLAANAERHAENPEFRADMIETLKLSVNRMNELLHRLSAKGPSSPASRTEVPLPPLIDRLIRETSRGHTVTAACETALCAKGDGEAIAQILRHLITNAIDASAADTPVLVAASRDGDRARIDVIDEGSGMSPEFIRQELFKPFVSTKASGFGLGAFEALQLARSMGGQLDVDSREGEGTRFTLWLPHAEEAAHRDRKEKAA